MDYIHVPIQSAEKPPAKVFGGKDNWKGNRQGSLSGSIHRNLITFLGSDEIFRILSKRPLDCFDRMRHMDYIHVPILCQLSRRSDAVAFCLRQSTMAIAGRSFVGSFDLGVRTGRLLAHWKEQMWHRRGSGYFYPDEIGIKETA